MPTRPVVQNRRRLAEAVQTARQRVGLTQVQLAQRARVSQATVQQIEGGYPFSRITRSMRQVAAALGWPEGWAQDILEGRQEHAPDVPAVPPAPRYEAPPEPARYAPLPGRSQPAAPISSYLGAGVQISDDTPDAELDRLLALIVTIKARRAARDEVLRLLPFFAGPRT